MVFSQGLLSRVTWKDSMKHIVEDYLSLPSFDHHAGDWMMALILYDLKDKATQEFPGIGITIPPYSAVMKGEVRAGERGWQGGWGEEGGRGKGAYLWAASGRRPGQMTADHIVL